MSILRTKLVVGGLTIAGAIGYLGVAGLRSGWAYYVGVDQYVAQPELRGSRVRLHGVVSGTGLVLGADGLSARFDLRGDAAGVSVEYRGTIPEMFQADRQVIVEGRMDADGVFHADVLLTKCASKYEARPAESTDRHAGPGERGTAP